MEYKIVQNDIMIISFTKPTQVNSSPSTKSTLNMSFTREEHIRYYGYDSDPPVEVSENVYRGPLPDKRIMNRLQELNIQSIITLCDEREAALFMKEHCIRLGLNHHHIPLSPFVRPSKYEISQFLQIVGKRKNSPVYVHCIHGRDRTGAMIGIFRLTQGWTLEEALGEMQRFKFGMEFSELLAAVQHYK